MSELRKSHGELTPARVELGVTGVSLPTAASLAFQAAQAEARDAVHESLATVSLLGELETLWRDFPSLDWACRETLLLHSAARDRATYLRRPDLGRRLAECDLPASRCDLAVVIADGLSALAVNRHAVPLLRELFALLGGWRLGPFCVVSQGRVAIGDEIGERLGAGMVVMLIGERPGLSAPDSLGAYITWQPRVGRTDAERNCVSNIRPEGLGYAEAAARIADCLTAAARLRVTGVALGQLTVDRAACMLKAPSRVEAGTTDSLRE